MKVFFDPQKLIKTSSYREFLSVFYKTNKQLNTQFSYSYLAKKCQFGSKSFIKEVVDGKKNLTLESAQKIMAGMAMPTLWNQYFDHLVRIEFAQSSTDKISLQKSLSRLRDKQFKKSTKTLATDETDYFIEKRWPYVYAALGTQEKGSTFDQIAKRTLLGDVEIERVLEFLLKNKLIIKKEKRYLPIENSAFFENLGSSTFFRNFFLQSTFNMAEKARKNMQSDSDVFFSMALSVDSSQMPALKKELTDLLDRFSIGAEQAEGDRVAEFVCGFYLS